MAGTGLGGGRALPAVGSATRAICERVADHLEADADDLAQTMADAVFEDIPAYDPIATSDQRATVRAHSREHVAAVVRAIRMWTLPRADELGFVNARAALRAEQQMPLSALLHSYRVGHRAVWERMARVLAGQGNHLDAALALTTLTLNYTELISAALAEGYVERQRSMQIQLDRGRRDLLESMLRGAVDRQAEVLKLASSFALVPGGDFLVVVLTSVREKPPGGEALTRVAEVLRRQLATGVAQPFVVVRHSEVVSVAPLARARPAAIARLVRLAHTEITHGSLGEQWVAGISTLCAGLGEVARGYQEALYALGSVSEQDGVRVLLDLRVSDYLVDRADGTALRMIPPLARRFFESSAATDRLLVDTLLAYANAELSVKRAADHLGVHPNTVTYRLQKLGQMLGRDLSTFSDLTEVVTWAQVIERLRNVNL